jgi:hypothetical protein
LLRSIDFRRAYGQIADASDHANPFSDADRSARIEQVEEI